MLSYTQLTTYIESIQSHFLISPIDIEVIKSIRGKIDSKEKQELLYKNNLVETISWKKNSKIQFYAKFIGQFPKISSMKMFSNESVTAKIYSFQVHWKLNIKFCIKNVIKLGR